MAGRGLGIRMLCLSCFVAGSSGGYAQNAYLWDGFYAGVNAGAAHGSTCNQWAPAGTGVDSSTDAALNSNNCLNSSFVGGLQFGYLRVGAMIPWGGHDNSVYYTPTGATLSTASFNGGKTYSSVGWVAGGGAEWGLKGAWSMSAEFLHASLGNASNSIGACGGTAAKCAAFSGMSFGDAHDASRANLFRIGVTYWFNFWD